LAIIADPSRLILSEAKNLVFTLRVNSVKQSASALINMFEIASSLTFLAMTLKTDFFSSLLMMEGTLQNVIPACF